MTLSAEHRRKLAAMIQLHRGWRQGWQAYQEARLVVLVRAAAMIETGLLSVPDVCQALQVSPSTWARYARLARPLMLDAAAEVDRALRDAGADESTTLADIGRDPDLELALETIGVAHRAAAGEDR